MHTILQDLRYGARMMRRSPAVALVAIVSLGLGIGGAAAVFGLADALLLRELPVKAPRELALFRSASGRVSVFESLNGNAQRNEQDFSVSSTSPETVIVGVSADARYTSLRRPVPPTFYVSYRQRATWGSNFVVRTSLEPTGIAEQVRATMRELDPALPVSNMRTQREQIQMSLQRERLFAQLATLLGGVTLLLAMIGLYGLLAYSVTQRTPELGLRMALGADRGSVRRMVLKQSLVLVVTGLALGIPAAIGGNRFVSSLLFDISPSSPLALTAASAIMLAVSLVAAFVPAHRASKVDPMVALRAE